MEHTPILATKKKIYRNGRRTFASRSQRKIPRATLTESPHALQPKFVAIQTGRSERTLPSTFDSRVQEKTTNYQQYAILYKIKRAPFS